MPDCRHQHLGRQGGAGTGRAGPDLWQTRLHRQRQWHRVHQQGDPEMGQRQQGRVALHRPRQAAAERLHRVASTAACATNASTRRSSTAWPMPAASWPSGATTTTTSGRIPRWATRPPQKRAGRLSNLMAPRPARLPHPKPTTIKPKDSRYERGTTGGGARASSRILRFPGKERAFQHSIFCGRELRVELAPCSCKMPMICFSLHRPSLPEGGL